MKWRKLGCIFNPRTYSGSPPEWMQSHAANAVAELVEGTVYRIYFNARNAQQQSSIGYFELDLTRPDKIFVVSREPVLTPGGRGLFDDSGVSLGCVLQVENRRYLYYTGWNLGVTVPWHNSIGLAVSEKEYAFKRYAMGPIMDRDPIDPYSLSYPFVLWEEGVFRMWYGSHIAWGDSSIISGGPEMIHMLKYAESKDGIHWQRSGQIMLPFKDDSEYAFSRPCVLKTIPGSGQSGYKMWYSYRGKAYRIGYAESEDGLHWERLDEKAGISVSDAGWDSEMICYPYVFQASDKNTYMLYAGNGYGLTGMGLAVLERD